MKDVGLEATIQARVSRLPANVQVGMFQYARAMGWLRSTAEKLPVDRKGEPIPWYTYPATSLLAKRMRSDLSVCEFGSGQSTLWWAARVERVTSVEHHAKWYERMKERAPSNVVCLHEALEVDGAYCRTAEKTGQLYDVIVIDGRDRVNCAMHSLSALTQRGIIIWDNSNRERYRPGQEYLLKNGFRRVDFYGPGPVKRGPWETAVFYREGNWLEL